MAVRYKCTVVRALFPTAKVSNYLQVSDSRSMMLFDEEHRRMVAKEGQIWDNIDSDTRYFYLEKESKSQGYPSKSQMGTVTPFAKPTTKRLGATEAGAVTCTCA